MLSLAGLSAASSRLSICCEGRRSEPIRRRQVSLIGELPLHHSFSSKAGFRGVGDDRSSIWIETIMQASASPSPGAAWSGSQSVVKLVSSFTRVELEKLIAEKLRSGQPRNLRFLLSRLRCREDAEDVLQDFGLKAIQGVGHLTDAGRIDAWLGVTLRNALFDRYRRNAGRRRLQDAAIAEPSFAPETDHEVEFALICLTRATARLKPAARELIRRAEFQQTPLKAIAADLGLTANNVGVRVHRAREALRREMHAGCAACDHRCALAARFLQPV